MNENNFKMDNQEEVKLPSIYDRTGPEGLDYIVRKARRSVFYTRFCLREYKKLFQKSYTSDQLYISHQDKALASPRFRKRRLKFGIIEDILFKQCRIPKREEIEIDYGAFGGPSREGWGKVREKPSKDIWNKPPEDTPGGDPWFKTLEYLSEDSERKAREDSSEE